MSQNTELLTIASGIVYLKDQFDTGDFYRVGNCPEFNISVIVDKKFNREYFSDSSGRLIELPTTQGSVVGATIGGSFVVEELTRDMVQGKWFFGSSSSSGTEFLANDLVAPVRAIRIKTDPINGISECITFPAVDVRCESSVSKITSSDLQVLSFEFSVLYDLNINTSPIVRVQEPGETLVDFCV